jgi:hypothetical protein
MFIVIFQLFLIYILNKKKEKFYKFLFFVHLFFGIISFCFLLIEQIKSCNCENLDEIRPQEFYKYNIGYILIVLNSSSCFCRFISYFFFFFIIKYSNELNLWESKFTILSNINKTHTSDIFNYQKDIKKDIYNNIFSETNQIKNNNEEFRYSLIENLRTSISPNSYKNIDLSALDSEKIRYDSNFLEKNMKNNNIFTKNNNIFTKKI